MSKVLLSLHSYNKPVKIKPEYDLPNQDIGILMQKKLFRKQNIQKSVGVWHPVHLGAVDLRYFSTAFYLKNYMASAGNKHFLLYLV